MRVLGITGSVLSKHGQHICIANAGKSTASKALQRGLTSKGIDSKIVSFASVLVELCVKATGLDATYFIKQELKNTPLRELGGKTPRTLMIERGYELRSQFGDNFLCKVIESKYKDYNGYLIIDDVRNEVEASWCRKYGTLYHVIRCVEQTIKEFLKSINLENPDPKTESRLSSGERNDVVLSLKYCEANVLAGLARIDGLDIPEFILTQNMP